MIMGKIVDTTINRHVDKWIRPWNVTQFNDLYNRDERFFAIIIKGVLSFLNRKVLMYNKGINHFVYNTGSSYMYVENNGYEFSWNETSGEDYIYMELPRCIVEIGNITIDMGELTQGFARGNYERKNKDNLIQGFNAEIKRIPIEFSLNLHYVLSNFNECMILIQEFVDTLVFQKYFKVNYLGNIVQCSIELPQDFAVQLNKIDLGAADTTQRTIDIGIKVCTNYPIINEASEIPTSQIIGAFAGYLNTGKRSDYITITIDGKDMTDGDIFLDLRPYDFDKNGKLDENEIIHLENFIDNFDVDGDGDVTRHDISMIEETFINNIYNIKYDILNLGEVDIANLNKIYELFNKLDFNHDNVVSQYELQTLDFIINHLDVFDFDNNLIIDYRDLNNLIRFIRDNLDLTWEELWNEFLAFFKKYIKLKELLEEIKNILNNNFKDILIWFEHTNYKTILTDDLYNKLYEWLKRLLEFLLYDLNKDKTLNNKDIDTFIDAISGYTEQQISYYVHSNIVIHAADHTLSDESISDIVPLTNLNRLTNNEE